MHDDRSQGTVTNALWDEATNASAKLLQSLFLLVTSHWITIPKQCKTCTVAVFYDSSTAQTKNWGQDLERWAGNTPDTPTDAPQWPSMRHAAFVKSPAPLGYLLQPPPCHLQLSLSEWIEKYQWPVFLGCISRQFLLLPWHHGHARTSYRRSPVKRPCRLEFLKDRSGKSFWQISKKEISWQITLILFQYLNHVTILQPSHDLWQCSPLGHKNNSWCIAPFLNAT